MTADSTATFNRLNISRLDFEEAHQYLTAYSEDHDPIIQCALVTAAIIAYARPFKKSKGNKADKVLTLPPDYFSHPDEAELHALLLELRDQGVAHSDFTRRPTGLLPSKAPGVMTWSRAFNPLSALHNIPLFKTMAWRLHCYCIEATQTLGMEIMNSGPLAAGGPPISTRMPDEVLRLTIPLSKFFPDKDRE